MLQWLVTSAQAIFTVCNLFCTCFDATLLYCIVKQRMSLSRSTGPFVYIIFLTGFGIVEKLNAIVMVDSWPLAEWLVPNGGYEKYRQFLGSYVTFIFLFCYLTPLFLDCMMTLHRILIFLSPMRSTKWFTDIKVAAYCILVCFLVFNWLLVQQVSSCTLNFNALTSFLESACAPDRHPVTWFQNKYLIYVPILSMGVNALLLFAQRISRKFWKNSVFALAMSNSQLKRENAMIRQAFFIGFYLSVYEVLYLHTRLYPESFRSMPFAFQTITYDLRLLAVGSLNFFIYFVLTQSTRSLVLAQLGWNSKKMSAKRRESLSRVASLSQTTANNFAVKN